MRKNTQGSIRCVALTLLASLTLLGPLAHAAPADPGAVQARDIYKFVKEHGRYSPATMFGRQEQRAFAVENRRCYVGLYDATQTYSTDAAGYPSGGTMMCVLIVKVPGGQRSFTDIGCRGNGRIMVQDPGAAQMFRDQTAGEFIGELNSCSKEFLEPRATPTVDPSRGEETAKLERRQRIEALIADLKRQVDEKRRQREASDPVEPSAVPQGGGNQNLLDQGTGQELQWRIKDLRFRGQLLSDNSVSLRPESSSGVSLILRAYDLHNNTLVGSIEMPVKIYPKAARIAQVWVEIPQGVLAKYPGQQPYYHQLHSLYFELRDNGTFQLTRSCDWENVCFQGSGVVVGPMAQRVIEAARKEEPNQRERDRAETDQIFEIQRMRHESSMNYLR